MGWLICVCISICTSPFIYKFLCSWAPNIFVTIFAKRGLKHTHSFKIHFSSPLHSYINGPTAHLFNTAEGWTVCFHSDLFLKPVRHPQVHGWPSNSPIFLWQAFFPWQADSRLWFTTQLSDEFGHGFSCFMWHVEAKMAPMDAIWLLLVKT